MDLWVTEYQTESLGLTLKVTKTLYTGKSNYQEIAVLETEQFGRMLVLDGTIQTTVGDEFIYHEMISHLPLFTHGNAEDVLIVGGGDGGVVREVLKHSSVRRVVLAEIDEKVVEVSKEFLPEISCMLDDPRVEVRIGDGIRMVKESINAFDVIIIDSTDPVGAAAGLFTHEFYESVSDSLRGNGVFVAQTESPFLHKALIKIVYNSVCGIFPIVRLYACPIPTYPGGYWSFIIGSKRNDPMKKCPDDTSRMAMRFYSPDIHVSAFTLPVFAQCITDQKEQA